MIESPPKEELEDIKVEMQGQRAGMIMRAALATSKIDQAKKHRSRSQPPNRRAGEDQIVKGQSKHLNLSTAREVPKKRKHRSKVPAASASI